MGMGGGVKKTVVGGKYESFYAILKQTVPPKVSPVTSHIVEQVVADTTVVKTE
jgi:hypothetical protein